MVGRRRIAPGMVALVALVLALAAAPAARADFGFQPGAAGFDVSVTKADGGPATLAGSHPGALSAHIALREGDAKDLFLELPPGLVENPRALPTCSQADFGTARSSPHEASRSGESCPAATQVGVVAVRTAAGTRSFGIFNLPPPQGRPSRFGFSPYGAPIVFTPQLRQADGEYGLTLASRNLPRLFDLLGLEMTIWGTPWDLSHDGQRGDCLNEVDPESPHGQCTIDTVEQGQGRRAYLTLPSSCSGALPFAAVADSWSRPGGYLPSGLPDGAQPAWQRAGALALDGADPGLHDCAGLGFSFGASALPSSALTSAPSGLTVHLNTSAQGFVAPTLRLASRPRRAVVSLPEGMTINPSVGAGLGACTPAQYAAESPGSAPGEGCPNPAKIGVGSVDSPLVEDSLKGSLFIATPFDNPFGSPYALYFVAKLPQRGFIVKVAGKLDADPGTGRLTATFDKLPQLPYSNLKIEFREGQRAPLVTPPSCGTYRSQIALTSWIDAAIAKQETSSFSLVRGPFGGPCPSGAAPFAPKAVAGSLNPAAGFDTSFYLHLTRTDAEQEITSYSAQLPPGLLGRIATIPFCSDAAIAAAKGRSGTAELNAPSCPAASAIGETVTGYGVGLAPAYAAGRFYLAGPYNGAPLSVVAINPAIVGPFDLGTVVIRSAIQVNPRNAQVTIDSSSSDPIPHIFAGIPLRLRDIRVYINRPNFMVNPTNCSAFPITSTLTGSDVPFVNPRGVQAAAISPFQLFDCIGLKFSPRLALRVKGPVKRGGHPRLRAIVTPRPGDANISSAAVTLPPSLFLEQKNIRDICTRAQAQGNACPPGSVVGSARAQTPLLAEPLEGPVYLRASSNLLPDLVAVLRWRGVQIVLEGRIDSHRGGLRGVFEGLPDAPVTKFTMTIFGGRKRGILVNAENLCRRRKAGVARFIGQNNLGLATKPKLTVKCKKKPKKRSRRGHARKRRGARGGNR